MLICTLPCAARELLTFRSGFSLEATSHTVQGANVVITLPNGTLTLPADDLSSVQVSPVEVRPVGTHAPALTPLQDTESLLQSAAQSAGLAPELIRSVATIESGLVPGAVSPKGAVGLMQLMPVTAAELGVLAADPGENVAGGAQYLRQLLLRYHGNAALALAAYNAGPGSVAKFGGVPPYTETRRYVFKVLRELEREQSHHAPNPATPKR